MSIHQDLLETKSPFRLPSDEEVFITREAERLQKQEIKEKIKNMKIWDKQTASTKGQLKRPKDSDFNIKVVDEVQQFPRPKDRGLITAALEIVHQRSKLPQNQKAENIREYVEQKKEIFRVEMKYGILKKERENIKKRISNKEAALKKSEELLNQDNERFTKHMDENKKQKDTALKNLNEEIALKKERDTDIKQLEQRKAAISAEISRNEESLEGLRRLKQFLDKLTPSDFLAEQERKFQEAYKKVKADWIKKEQKNLEYFESYDAEGESQHSGGTNHSGRKKRSEPVNLDKRFDELFKRGKMDEVYRQADEQMYFSDEKMLLDILKELEDNNLFLIELIQEMDHQLEISKSELDNFKRKKEKKWEETMRERDSLAVNLKSITAKMRVTTKKIAGIQNKKENNKAAQNLKDEIGKLIFSSSKIENDSGLQPIEMLKMLEGIVNPLMEKLKLLKSTDAELFSRLADEKSEEKKEQRIQEQIERKREEDRIKALKAKEREERKNPKKMGRQYMMKVLHQKKNVEKEVEEVIKTEEELIRDFIEETTS